MRVLLLLAMVAAASAKCPTGWYEMGGMCYKAYCPALTWSAAQSKCQAAVTNGTAQLAKVDTTSQAKFLVKLLKGNAFWIGATDANIEGTWKWADGSAITTTQWKSGEPNGGGDKDGNADCAHVRYPSDDGLTSLSAYQWYAESCYTTLSYICSTPETAPFSNSGAVDFLNCPYTGPWAEENALAALLVCCCCIICICCICGGGGVGVMYMVQNQNKPQPGMMVAQAQPGMPPQQAGAVQSAGPLPPGWAEAVDPASGQVYYHHTTTGETCWTRPAGMTPTVAPVAVQVATAQATPAAAATGEWTTHTDPASGKQYRHNAATNQTEWL